MFFDVSRKFLCVLLLLPISDHLHPIEDSVTIMNRCAPRKRFVNLGPGGWRQGREGAEASAADKPFQSGMVLGKNENFL